MPNNQRHAGNFLRRIKTHVVGPQHRFAIVVPSELAQICQNEARTLDIEAPAVSEAGVEFSGKLTNAYTCNLWLRTASRILCRLAPFRAGVSEELFYKVSQIPWELWLNPEVPLDIDAHVEHSRISHEGKVAEIVSESIEKSLRKAVPGKIAEVKAYDISAEAGGKSETDYRRLKQKILVRLVENHCQVSLDTSGALLHERGYRLRHTGAPLRETLAAAILLKSGWTSDEPLIDGMCGSGTFPIEAALIARRIAPGLNRDFLFRKWPSFQTETWKYLLRKASEVMLPKVPDTIIGIDVSPAAVIVSAENASRAAVSGDIEWEQMDFFEFRPRTRGLKKGLLVLNPPYGIRMEAEEEGLYERIGAHLKLNFKGWKYAVLAGSRLEAAALGMGRVRLWNIRHGGRPITVVFGKVAA